MNSEMLDDLGRWERGEVSVEDLAERHPHGEPAALAEMHTLLTMLTTEPDADRGPSWERLLADLPPQVAVVDPPARRAGRLKYFLAAFVAGAVIAPGTAAAGGVEIIREVTEHVGRGLGNLVMPDRAVSSSAPAPIPESSVAAGSSGLEIAAAPVPSPEAVPTDDPVAIVPVIELPASPIAVDSGPRPRQSAPAASPAPAPASAPSPSSPTGDNGGASEQSPAPRPGNAGPSAGSASRSPNEGSSDATAPDDRSASPASLQSRGGDHSRSDRGNAERETRDEQRSGRDHRGQT